MTLVNFISFHLFQVAKIPNVLTLNYPCEGETAHSVMYLLHKCKDFGSTFRTHIKCYIYIYIQRINKNVYLKNAIDVFSPCSCNFRAGKVERGGALGLIDQSV